MWGSIKTDPTLQAYTAVAQGSMGRFDTLIYLLANSTTKAKVQFATWVYTPSRNKKKLGPERHIC